MNSDIKKIATIGTIALLIVLLASCNGENEKNISEKQNNTNSNKIDTVQTPATTKTIMNNSIQWIDLYNYVAYSESEIKKSEKLKVLFFNDNNSESIKTLKDNLQKSKIHDWLVMYQIDFNSNSELKNKYWVTSSHTFVQVDGDLNIVRKWEGSKTIDQMHVSLTSPTTIVKMEEISTVKSEWIYGDYSDEILSSSKWNIVLFFAATWCPSCKTADNNLKSETIPEGLTILKVDYDSSLDLKKKYWITTQHTFVQVDNKWNMITKWIGSRDVDSISEELK